MTSQGSDGSATSVQAERPFDDPAATRPFYRYLGIRATAPDAQGHPQLELVSRPELENSRGEIHGGAVAALLDASIGVAVRAAYPDQTGATTVSLSVNYAEPGRGRLLGTAQVMRTGGSLASAHAQVFDETGKLVAHALGTMKILRPSAPKRPA